MFLEKGLIQEIVCKALNEDAWTGDITSEILLEPGKEAKALVVIKEEGIIAGLKVAEEVFKQLNKNIILKPLVNDGERVKKDTVILEIEGSAIDILKGERCALNFLQRLSGISTMTRRYVEKVKGLSVRIADTRKTTPGLRFLEKYAVRIGGGYNHRMGLYDAVLIKDNHLAVFGSISRAIEKVRENLPHMMKIEVEVEKMDGVREALEAGADIIMLDNMEIEEMREAVRLVDKRAIVEASGRINLDNIYSIALTGVDVISVGALTHHIKALDISLNIKT